MKENIYARGYVLGRCLNSALNVKSDFVSLPDGRGIERAAETPSPPILPRRLPPHLVRTPNGSSGLAQSPTQRLIQYGGKAITAKRCHSGANEFSTSAVAL